MAIADAVVFLLLPEFARVVCKAGLLSVIAHAPPPLQAVPEPSPIPDVSQSGPTTTQPSGAASVVGKCALLPELHVFSS